MCKYSQAQNFPRGQNVLILPSRKISQGAKYANSLNSYTTNMSKYEEQTKSKQMIVIAM